MQSLLKGCREKNILSNDCLKIHISSKDNVKCKFHLKICEKTRICSKFYGKICDIHQRIGNKKKIKKSKDCEDNTNFVKRSPKISVKRLCKKRSSLKDIMKFIKG